MNNVNHSSEKGLTIWQYAIWSSVAVIVLTGSLSYQNTEWLNAALALALVQVCLYPAVRYFSRAEKNMPFFPIFCLSYAFQFAFPVFTRDNTLRTIYGFVLLDSSDLAIVQVMVIVGVVILQIAFYGLRQHIPAGILPRARLQLQPRRAAIYAVCFGIFIPFIDTSTLIPEEIYRQFSAIFNVLQNQALVAIVIWGWLVYSEKSRSWHKTALYATVGLATLKGLSTLFSEQAVVPVVVFFMTKWLYTRRPPLTGLATVGIVLILLQPVKGEVRRMFWSENQEASAVTRIATWAELTVTYWTSAASDKANLNEGLASSTGRIDLLRQFTYIYSLTPSVLPFRNGATYDYFIVAWIPRALWPEKPEAKEGNRMFAIEYGLSTYEGAEKTTYGMSLIGEGYINFGFIGVLGIMLVQGILLSMVERVFGTEMSGVGGYAITLGFFVYFFNGLGSSAAYMFGNVVQSLTLNAAMLYWARSHAREQSGATRDDAQQFKLYRAKQQS